MFPYANDELQQELDHQAWSRAEDAAALRRQADAAVAAANCQADHVSRRIADLAYYLASPESKTEAYHATFQRTLRQMGIRRPYLCRCEDCLRAIEGEHE